MLSGSSGQGVDLSAYSQRKAKRAKPDSTAREEPESEKE